MDPWGATEPLAWWTVINRARAIENIVYVAAANQGASLKALPALFMAGRQPGGRLRRPSVSGSVAGSQASELLVAPIDISALRHERESRRGHHMPAHLRTEAYPVYQSISIRR
jgi:predicted amidohydrolase